jgi:hypothetical protein
MKSKPQMIFALIVGFILVAVLMLIQILTFRDGLNAALNIEVLSQSDWLLNDPHLLIKTLKDVSSDKEALEVFIRNAMSLTSTNATDGEDFDALVSFFWGMRGGIAMELGAMDGVGSSMTLALEIHGWRRILIEGNPRHRQALQNLTDSVTVSAAICDKMTAVHYTKVNKFAAIAGVVEFMSLDFMQQFHPEIYEYVTNRSYTHINTNQQKPTFGSVDWARLSDQVEAVPCVSLDTILRRVVVPHVNLFVLDIEGGELDALKTIDWTYSTFDVLCVETDPQFRPRLYSESVAMFLRGKGYRVAARKGRNTWFVRVGFRPVARIKKDIKSRRGTG